MAMSKFLHLGWSFADVVRATTARPAEVLGWTGTLGTLRPGAYADVATFIIDEGQFELFDIHGNHRTARRMIRTP